MKAMYYCVVDVRMMVAVPADTEESKDVVRNMAQNALNNMCKVTEDGSCAYIQTKVEAKDIIIERCIR